LVDLDARTWLGGREAVRMIDHRVPADLHIPLDESDPRIEAARR
jgi:hypothetical protein